MPDTYDQTPAIGGETPQPERDIYDQLLDQDP